MLFSEINNILRGIDYYEPDILHFCEDIVNYYTLYGHCKGLILLQQKIKEMYPDIKLMRSIPITQPGKKRKITSIEFAKMFEHGIW